MKISRRMLAAAFLAATTMISLPATAGNAIRFGVLTCDISAGVGLIITQKQELGCTFTPDNGGPVDVYSGQFRSSDWNWARRPAENSHGWSSHCRMACPRERSQELMSV